MLPAVSEASEVVSRFSVAPTEAMSWPFLSTRKTIFALASRANRSQTVLICWNSSSYITICGCIGETSSLSWSRSTDANRRFDFSLQLARARLGCGWATVLPSGERFREATMPTLSERGGEGGRGHPELDGQGAQLHLPLRQRGSALAPAADTAFTARAAPGWRARA